MPVGALGLPFERGLRLWGLVASPDGRRVVRGDLTGHPGQPEALGTRLAELLLARGAGELLQDLEGTPLPSPP